MTLRIDLTADGIVIDDVLHSPLSPSILTDLLGAPRVVPPTDPTPDDSGHLPKTWFVWDDDGLSAIATEADARCELRIWLSKDVAKAAKREGDSERPLFEPSGLFTGVLTVGGEAPLDAVRQSDLESGRMMPTAELGDWEAACFLNSTELGWIRDLDYGERSKRAETGEFSEAIRSAAEPISFVILAYITPKPKPKKSSGKWKHTPATEPVLEIASFPFRLAIIEELMYSQEVLEPKFDVYDFSQDRGAHNFDPDEYYDEMIPSVRTWFRKLPIPERFAENIEELTLDGGNEVFLQLIPQWDGEDDTFAIKSLKDSDLDLFPQLKSIDDIGGFLSPRARKTLEKRGITVE